MPGVSLDSIVISPTAINDLTIASLVLYHNRYQDRHCYTKQKIGWDAT